MLKTTRASYWLELASIWDRRRGDFPADATVDWLFDKSGGRGAPPRSWPEAREGAFCGYAGGLNPDNIGVALPAIAACVPEGQPYWIDMKAGCGRTTASISTSANWC